MKKENKIYRTIIIGLGNVGFKYSIQKNKVFSHSDAINSTRNFKLIAGADNNLNKVKSFRKKYNLNAYLSFKTLLKKETFDVVVLCVPTNKHYIILKEMLKFTKNKIILCEKPCTNSMAQIKNIMHLLKKNKSHCYINFQRLFLNSSNKLKKILNNHKKFIINVSYSKGILNTASHFISLFIFFFGEKFKIEKVGTSKKIKGDFNCDFKIKYSDKIINFKYIPKNKKAHGSFEAKNDYFYLKYLSGGRKIFIRDKKSNKFKKIISDVQTSQITVYKILNEQLKNKKSDLSSINNALKTMSVIEKLK